MATQNAIVVNTVGGPEVLEHQDFYPIPVPGVGEVLVKNTLVGVNYVDTYFRSGFYKSQKPEVLGREGVGEVVALGPSDGQVLDPKSELHIGDRVAWFASGGYAQHSVAPVKKTVKIPDDVATQDVAGSFLGGLTALAMLDETAVVKPGDWVLLHAAAGSVGLLMVQLLKLRGASLIATAGGPAKVAMVKALGADFVIDYKDTNTADWPQVVQHLTDGTGVDIVFDSVGKDTWEGSLASVRRKGMVVWFGNASGPVPPMSLHLLASRCIKIARPTLGGYIDTREEFYKYATQLFRVLAQKQLKVHIHKTYALKEVQQAHQNLESRRTTGKLLLKP